MTDKNKIRFTNQSEDKKPPISDGIFPGIFHIHGLFWRNFFMLFGVIMICVLGWAHSVRVLNEKPWAQATASHIISVTNITRYSLITADPMFRHDLLMVLATREGVRIMPREPDDKFEPIVFDYTAPASAWMLEEIVQKELGAETILASSVNGSRGLWISFDIEGDKYWLMTNTQVVSPSYGNKWFGWAMIALVLSIIGAIIITRRIIDPLEKLSENAKAFGRGKAPSPLPEKGGAQELCELNKSFNEMVKDIQRMDYDREVMIAGVSHDLRTPITRMILEAEIADIPDETRYAILSDLNQMETIVNQFMAYAKSGAQNAERISFAEIVGDAIGLCRLQLDSTVELSVNIPETGLFVKANKTELARVVQNLITNALRYGRSEDGILRISFDMRESRGQVILTVSDLGPGLDTKQADRLVRPFERGDNSRQAVTGTGLGLAIVDRVVKRIGGKTVLSSTDPHGLTISIHLPICKI